MSAIEIPGADAPSDETVACKFEFCEDVIQQFERGQISTKDLQPKFSSAVEKLEELTKDVSTLELFSDNEFIEELPTSSVRMLLIPCYLGVCYHNTITEPEMRIAQLKSAKVCYMDFLKRLHDYEVITFKLPWDLDDDDDEVTEVGADKKIHRPSGDDLRKEKIQRFHHQKNLEAALACAQRERERNPDDDNILREIYIVQLRYWAVRVLTELDSIEDEIPILEHMQKIRAGLVKSEAPRPKPSSRPPFIITRTVEQKKVFGLGYPAVPTMTVDEWAAGMEKSGRWGHAGHGHDHGDAAAALSAQQKAADLSDSEKEDEVDPEELRQKQLRWDEYKDTHRRGWGNTHNKG